MLTGKKNMEPLTRAQACACMNRYGSCREPFIFVIDYAMKECLVIPLSEVDPGRLLYTFRGACNTSRVQEPPFNPAHTVEWSAQPCTPEEYDRSFDVVMHHLRMGNSYLTNLTCATPVQSDFSLREIFHRVDARYKLWLDERFLVFSPETFVRIGADGSIASFPMKGTIDAREHDARERILADPKETAEHATIVDLIRNDLSQVAHGVHVARYRFIDTVETHRGDILQVSSEIRGCLAGDYYSRLGEIVFAMLPAGSVTGAPKHKTLEIISQAETYERGYYTGVCGIFDGCELDSGVMIRFLERAPQGGYLFKSGGGITALSSAQSEYNEMKTKIYVPLRRNP